MNGHWVLETHGDPLGRLREFVAAVWQEAELVGLLAPSSNGERDQVVVTTLREREELEKVNPFKPLMLINAAREVPPLLAQHPTGRLGVLLRPCEMRAAVEMAKRNEFSLERLLTFCVDCLSTLPTDEYRWRAERKGAYDSLTEEALQFARQGGIVPYRYRSACQMCLWPQACATADIRLGVLGLPVRRALLVGADPETAERLALGQLTDGEAPNELVAQHERVIGKLIERRRRARQRVRSSLDTILPDDVQDVVALFEQCGGCEQCLAVCPLCAVERPQRNEEGHFGEAQLTRWLISCAGCGMCEEVCPQNHPLSVIFARIREEMEADYVPGAALEEPLPAVPS